MQKFLYLPLFFLILSCKNTSENSTSETANTTIETESKSINIRVPDEEDGGEMLLGNINFNGLQEALSTIGFKPIKKSMFWILPPLTAWSLCSKMFP